MVDAVSSVAKIVDVALAIKGAVDTVQQNKEDCDQLGQRVSRLSAILPLLESSGTTKHPAVRAALDDLQGTLGRALKLVKDCQAKNVMCVYFAAAKMCKQLHLVNREIMDHLVIANFGNNLQNTIISGAHALHGVHRRNPKDAGLMENSNGKLSINRARSEVNGEKGILLAGSEVTPLHELVFLRLLGRQRQKVKQRLEGRPESSKSFQNDNVIVRSTSTLEELLQLSRRHNGCSYTNKNEETVNGFTMYSLTDLKAATNNFSKSNLISEGGCAIVYKGKIQGGPMVAIKKFSVKLLQQKYVEHYVNVFSVLQRHENIVNLLGYCYEGKQQMKWINGKYEPFVIADTFVVVEYLPNGTLSSIMEGSLSLQEQTKLDWSSRFRIILGIAQGLAYLHTKNIVHMDVKPDNIILDSNMNPKICDFEIAQRLDFKGQELFENIAHFAGTPAYVPPEYLVDGIISVKNDVYSFGVLLLCTISGMRKSELHHDSIDWAQEVVTEEKIKRKLDLSLCDDSQLNGIERCINVGLLCTHKDREHRPHMSRVLELLSEKESLAMDEVYDLVKPRKIECHQDKRSKLSRASLFPRNNV